MNAISLDLLAATTLAETVADPRTWIVVGVGLALVSLWLVARFLAQKQGSLERNARREPADSAAQGTAISQASSAGSIDAHLIPILVAAATAAIGHPVRLRRVTFINSNTVSGWAEAGRTSIQLSHNIRRTM